MKKIISSLSAIISIAFITTAFAQTNVEGILPTSSPLTAEQCLETLNTFHENYKDNLGAIKDTPSVRAYILGCAIKTGRIELWMIPYFITYVVNFILSIAGSISVLFIIIGAYQYIFGGLTDQKEKGKNTITYALMGFIVVLVAWILVNFVQVQLTS